ncbi:hypothetical protein GGU10DRAFT_279779, partial [Lentinula aff. detonsa]
LSRDLPRKLVTVLIQLRTGHAPLQAHLYKIKKVDTHTCPCCKRHPETVFHYLIQCRTHCTHQDQLRQQIGQRNMNLAALLMEKSLLKHLFQYIDETKQFHYILGDLPHLADKD